MVEKELQRLSIVIKALNMEIFSFRNHKTRLRGLEVGDLRCPGTAGGFPVAHRDFTPQQPSIGLIVVKELFSLGQPGFFIKYPI